MNYEEFLQISQYQDTPYARQAFQEQFGGAENLGLGSPIELQDRGMHGTLMSDNEVLYDTTGQEGRNFLVATDRYHNEFPLSGAINETPLLDTTQAPPTDPWGTGVDRGMSGMDAYQGPTDYDAYKAYLNEELTHDLAGNQISGFDRFASDTGPYTYQNEVYDAPIDSGLLGSTSASSPALALEKGPSGYSSIDAYAGTTLPYATEGTAEALATDTATSGSSAWGGPATFAGNMALNMIPTRDRQKVDTPLGDKGSYSGILKGGGKGALLGGTISGGNPYAIAGGAALGVLGGASGYFDSTSAPIINISRIKQRGGGMSGGLLGGGSMYG